MAETLKIESTATLTNTSVTSSKLFMQTFSKSLSNFNVVDEIVVTSGTIRTYICKQMFIQMNFIVAISIDGASIGTDFTDFAFNANTTRTIAITTSTANTIISGVYSS